MLVLPIPTGTISVTLPSGVSLGGSFDSHTQETTVYAQMVNTWYGVKMDFFKRSYYSKVFEKSVEELLSICTPHMDAPVTQTIFFFFFFSVGVFEARDRIGRQFKV